MWRKVKAGLIITVLNVPVNDESVTMSTSRFPSSPRYKLFEKDVKISPISKVES